MANDITRRRGARAAVSPDERTVSDFFDNACVGMHWVAADGAILQANQAELDLLGYERHEYVGRHIADFHVDQQVIDDIIGRLARGETLKNYPSRMRCKDGSIRHVLISSNVLFENGEFIHTRCVTVDVTEQVRAEEARKESEARLRALTDAAPVLLSNFDREARFKFVNESYAKHFDMSPEELRGKHAAEVLGEDTYARMQPHVAEVLRGHSVEFDLEGQHDGSDPQAMRGAYTPEYDSNGDVVGWIAASIDISDLKQTEWALRESERRFREMVDGLPAALYVTDAEGRITHFNRAAVELSGRVPELGSDKWCVTWRLYHLDGTPLPHDECPMALALRGEKFVPGVELIAEKPSGERVYVAPYPTPLRDNAGRIVGGINMLVDITERKLADEQLRESEERYRRLVELLPVAVYTCEAPSGVVTYYNDQAAKLWGRAPRPGDTTERFCGSYRLYGSDGTRVPHEQCPMAVALREGSSFRDQEVVIQRPDGTCVPVLINIDPVRDASGRITGAINVVHDMSAQRRAEQSLREQKDELQTLLETLPVGVFIAHDPECRRITGNRTALDLLRMPAGSNLSKTAALPEAPPSHFDVSKDGHALPPEALPLQRAARGQIVQGEELEHRFADGTTQYTLISAQPLYDGAGRPRGAIASMLDITGLKEAETRLKEADRRKNEFLATLSHELRNPLAPMSSGLAVLGNLLDDPPRFSQTKAIVERQLNHLVRLIDDLLDVSRISRGKVPLYKERVELASVIRQALETNRPLAQHHTMEVVLPERPVHLHGDPVRLTQVFGNLLNNACKYTPAGGMIRLTAECRNGKAIVSVRDSGIGLSPEGLEGIFDMFSQVDPLKRSSGGGLGVGLSLAKRLVEMHGGTVSARSDGPGLGSEFTVLLPALDETVSGVPAKGELRPEDMASATNSGRRVLVVDDNVDAATALAALLELKGHDAQVAHDGREAIERVEALRPEVVLLDIGLPEIDGYDVCRTIRQRPWGKDILIVALTGWGQENDRHRSAEAGFDRHLVKPVDPVTLEQSIGAHPPGRSAPESRDTR